MKNRILALSLAGALVASVLTATVLAQTTTGGTTQASGAKKANHPAIHNAIAALQAAKSHMQNANHDFGGHRAAALKECDAALAELQQALQYDK